MSDTQSPKLSTESYKGVRDFYPEDMALQQYIFDTWSKVAESFGFLRYDASVLEPAELYKAKTGEEIVSEQTYTFTDRGDRQVTLRPEMTPTVARMVAKRRRELSFPLRWYSIPNLFRYERPQRGRLREHWQFNCDIFGSPSLHADAEIILLGRKILLAFGATDEDFSIRLNNRKLTNSILKEVVSLDDSATYKTEKLIDRKDKMGIDAFRTELAGIVASKAEPLIELFEVQTLAELLLLAPHLKEKEGYTELLGLMEILKSHNVANTVYSPTLMRGLDYYDGNVFELFDQDPKNRRALLGGGRYDNLTDIFDIEPVPAVGFGMGDVTVADFLESHDLLPELHTGPDVMLITTNENLMSKAEDIAAELREKSIRASVNLMDKKLGDQVSLAVKQNARMTITVGEDELESGIYTLRNLADGNEISGSMTELVSHVKTL